MLRTIPIGRLDHFGVRCASNKTGGLFVMGFVIEPSQRVIQQRTARRHNQPVAFPGKEPCVLRKRVRLDAGQRFGPAKLVRGQNQQRIELLPQIGQRGGILSAKNCQDIGPRVSLFRINANRHIPAQQRLGNCPDIPAKLSLHNLTASQQPAVILRSFVTPILRRRQPRRKLLGIPQLLQLFAQSAELSERNGPLRKQSRHVDRRLGPSRPHAYRKKHQAENGQPPASAARNERHRDVLERGRTSGGSTRATAENACYSPIRRRRAVLAENLYLSRSGF